MPDDILTVYAGTQPDKIAVIDDKSDDDIVQLTYAEFEAQANRLGNVLLSLGAKPRGKVIWCGPNSVPVVTVMSATRKIGVVAVALNYRLTAEEAHYVIEHSDAEIAYVDAEYQHLFTGLVGRLPKLRHVIVYDGPAQDGMLSSEDLTAAASDQPPDVGEAVGTGGAMIYTSGTTGKPKGAVRYATDQSTGLALVGLIGYRPDDIYLTSGPLYHSGPMAFLGVGLLFGQTLIVQRKFESEDWLRLLDKYKATSTFSAPALVRMVCALPAEIKAKYDRSSMRIMLANAAPWSFALKQQYVADFPPESLWEIYGSTELGVDCVLEPKDQMRKPGSCGKPAPGVEIGLFDEDGNEVTGTGPEHSGELYVRSTGVFDEYYKQRDSYDANSRGEWHTVGDIAYRDDEGYLYICDRKSDMIISGGMNIYPAEIEAALEQHPAIYDVAVFGIPSEEWGEMVHATIVLAPDATLDPEEIKAFGKEHLASYKVPRSVDYVDELPRTGSGKILKRQLRAPYWAGRTAQVG
ncbi:MAG TPA: AMP-binding protein [Streptosporangiaceae bacterium]|jgi:fatty-acyl-CoA synthase/long-chain acyl-CoA synthetase